jgi:hypothetical protein
VASEHTFCYIRLPFAVAKREFSLPTTRAHDICRVVARLDRKRLGRDTFTTNWNSIRGVFDKQTRRKPLVFAADAVRYGI